MLKNRWGASRTRWRLVIVNHITSSKFKYTLCLANEKIIINYINTWRDLFYFRPNFPFYKHIPLFAYYSSPLIYGVGIPKTWCILLPITFTKTNKHNNNNDTNNNNNNDNNSNNITATNNKNNNNTNNVISINVCDDEGEWMVQMTVFFNIVMLVYSCSFQNRYRLMVSIMKIILNGEYGRYT